MTTKTASTDNVAGVDASRPNSHRRGYDRHWEKLAALKKRIDPICEIRKKCAGDPVEQVDHIIPLSKGGGRLTWSNLQSACASCHSWKTRTIDSPGFNASPSQLAQKLIRKRLDRAPGSVGMKIMAGRLQNPPS